MTDRFKIAGRDRWVTVDGDAQAAIILDTQTRHAFTVLGPIYDQELVVAALNFLEARIADQPPSVAEAIRRILEEAAHPGETCQTPTTEPSR